ncbi:MAG: hypothetical protein PF486_04890 [Prolixibacteraceae bacterium]|jgi:hypothetical protein|nr:hypothetical protein [Prolixibacteraceae bacterium]
MENKLVSVFSEQMVLTIDNLKDVLQTNSRMTVFRKLKQLPYKSSYSHCGKYYTLNTLVKYNKNGIWNYNDIYFSKYGTLKNCVLENVDKSKTGYTSLELEELLHVPVYNTVLDLYNTHKINRKQIGKEYIYLSIKNEELQFIFRKQEIQSKHAVSKDDTDEYLDLFMTLLNEKQQRLFAGYESLKLGYGGDKIIAQKTGLNVKTVSQGRQELINRDFDIKRIRKIGAGRPSLKKTKKF